MGHDRLEGNEVNEAQVIQVFEHWKTIMGHERARLDMARARVIKQRFRDGYTLEDLCLAIDGCAASAFHMGENDRGQVYDSVTLILRDADHVDKFIRAGERAHQMIEQSQRRKEQERQEQTRPAPTEEEKARVRELLRGVKLKRVA